MKILYVSQYFPPEIGAPSARVFELSREWVRRGHSVTVLTAFAHHPTGIKAERDRGVLTRRERVEGIEVVRTYVYAAPNRGTVRRMTSYASFMASAVLIGGCRIRRPDVVIGTSPQLLCAVAARTIAAAYGSPFVFEVRDLWPESILAVEAMRQNLIVRALKGVARGLYGRADRIVTVGEGYRRRIHDLYGIPLDRMDVVPNGVDFGLFRPGPRDNDIRRELGWEGRFVVLYLGTHGMAHALDKVLEAARLLRAEARILFAFVGDGAEKESLRRRAAELGLPNVRFIEAQPKSRVPPFYAACDLGLVTLRRAELFQDVLPSKIFEYLAMERPIVLSVGGEARALVEEAGAGEYVPPENPEALADAVRRLAADRDRLERMGRRGRDYVLARFDRARLAERYLQILEALTA
ncbi:MAG TPA: glycosyltransferase family 4 protein [Planctomycetota bacterium]|nr:glycosyltransferase family 4 protein [Planctomycetota bacterium]